LPRSSSSLPSTARLLARSGDATPSAVGADARALPFADGTFDANIQDTVADDVSGDFEQSLVSTGFAWKMSQPHGWHPGVDVNLTHSLQWTRAGGGSGGVTDWRVLAGVRIAYGN
ncbi:MAG: hypothetical protein P8166_14550, partial [Candidatus Thiodiazotropha sp.]